MKNIMILIYSLMLASNISLTNANDIVNFLNDFSCGEFKNYYNKGSVASLFTVNLETCYFPASFTLSFYPMIRIISELKPVFSKLTLFKLSVPLIILLFNISTT